MKIINKLLHYYHYRNNKSVINYLRKKGLTIGNNVIIRHPMSSRIDLSRPSLITIGDNVDINMNFQLLTHDWSCFVFRNLYNDFINSSGKVKIGNNVYIATNVIILKGVTIGNNVIIGAGSVVTKDIPDNCVATGIPCKVICNIDEYYKKRKERAIYEAKEYVQSIKEKYGRPPLITEMKEEFIYFVNKENINRYSKDIPIKQQVGSGYKKWLENHKSTFNSFEDFIQKI